MRHSKTNTISAAERSWNTQALFKEIEFYEVGMDLRKVLRLIRISDPHQCNSDGWTPLILAAYHGHTDCVQALLPVSDPNHQDKYGTTALIYASEYGRLGCVRALLAVSDPNHQDNDGRTALMGAASSGYMRCVKELLPVSVHGCQDKDGDTALMCASKAAAMRCIKELLSVSDVHQVKAALRVAKNATCRALIEHHLALRHAQMEAEHLERAIPVPISKPYVSSKRLTKGL